MADKEAKRADSRRERDKQVNAAPEQPELSWAEVSGAPRPGDEVIPLHPKNNRRAATLREVEEKPEDFEGLVPADKLSKEEASERVHDAKQAAKAVKDARDAEERGKEDEAPKAKKASPAKAESKDKKSD